MNSTSVSFLDSLAAQIEETVSHWLAHLFGPRMHQTVIGSVTWADIGIVAAIALAMFLAHAIAAYLLGRRKRHAAARPETESWKLHLLIAIGKPLYLLIWIFGMYITAGLLLAKYETGDQQSPARQLADKLFNLAVFVTLFWAFFRFTRVLDAKLLAWARRTDSKVDDVIVPLVGRTLRVVVPLMGVFFALPLIGLPQQYEGVIARGSSILIILATAWIVSQVVTIGEKAVLAKYDVSLADNLQARRVYTQVHVLSRTLYFIIAVFTVASILMLFEEVRRFGTSLLASAGVVGVIAGFAAQRTIANLFAGFQLAMTQPIRLDDVVIVESEWGRVEEITLTYVVIHIWDDRRLVVPLSYFIEKPFQNWTRISANLLGAVTVQTDYSLPLEEVRQAVKQIVENNPKWDKRFWNLQVTDATERTMQLRVLATAADSGSAWDLRCDIRERLIAFIQKNHPQCLPQVRWMDLGVGKEKPQALEAGISTQNRAP